MDEETIGVKLQERVHELCSEHLGGTWSKISASEITISPISGGASNLLYCCSLPDKVTIDNGELTHILIRFYGVQSSPKERGIQCEIFDLLSKKRLGPKLYGVFDEGRLEEFLPANSLTCNEIRNEDISRIISEKLAVVHSLNVPIDKDESWLIERLQEWSESICSMDDASSVGYLEHSDNWHSTHAIACELLSINFRQEIKFIKEEVFERSNSIKVFSHNDLHQGNILFAEPSKRRPTLRERIVFIDFEYCSYNYRACDIANHLSEWLFQYGTPNYPHFICYKEKFPTRDDQLNFIHHYLSEIHRQQEADQERKEEQTVDDTQKMMIVDGCMFDTNMQHQQQQLQLQEQDQERDQLEIELELEEGQAEVEDEDEERVVKVDVDYVDDIDVDKEEEEEYDDDYILCNDRREITGDIHANEKNNKNNNNKLVNGIKQLNGKSTKINGANADSGDGCIIDHHKLTSQHENIAKKQNKLPVSNNITEEDEQLYEEIQPFYMAVSLFWTLWCIRQAQTSTIKFGYWEHAMDRWNLYTQFKTSHLKKAAAATNNVESKSSYANNKNH